MMSSLRGIGARTLDSSDFRLHPPIIAMIPTV
jgi:hypothetical protein